MKTKEGSLRPGMEISVDGYNKLFLPF